MKILNKTNCSIALGGEIIEKYCTKDINIAKSDKRLRFLLSSDSISIIDEYNKQNKKVNKTEVVSTINNISDKPVKKKNKTGERKENTTLGDENIDA